MDGNIVPYVYDEKNIEFSKEHEEFVDKTNGLANFTKQRRI
jgi:hypothetical protein